MTVNKLSIIKKELEKIRPFLQSHGGDVQIKQWDEKKGILYLYFQGRCGTCPMSQLTFHNLVADSLGTISGVKDIKLVNQDNEE